MKVNMCVCEYVVSKCVGEYGIIYLLVATVSISYEKYTDVLEILFSTVTFTAVVFSCVSTFLSGFAANCVSIFASFTKVFTKVVGGADAIMGKNVGSYFCDDVDVDVNVDSTVDVVDVGDSVVGSIVGAYGCVNDAVVDSDDAVVDGNNVDVVVSTVGDDDNNVDVDLLF